MKNRVFLFLLAATMFITLTSCGEKKENPSGSSDTDASTSDNDVIVVTDTDAKSTEAPPEVPVLHDSGWCAVGLTEGDKATILADTGAVLTLKYIGEVTPGLIHGYEYEKEAEAIKLTLASTFPEVADRDSGGNDLSVWNMGAYPSSSSVYYGTQYTLSENTPVFVRYSNTEWRLAHGKSAFASDGLTRGYINVTGSNLNFVMIVGACGSLENMKPANAEVTQCMDPDGNGFDRGNISLDGSEIPDDKPIENLDENGLTIPDSTKMSQTLIYKKVGDKVLRMSFYKPTNQVYEKAPVYYLITGGGWNSCDRQGMVGFSGISMDALRRQGFAVTSIDYRILQDGVDMNGIISDCMDGVRYLVKYADNAGIDPEKIVIAGHSAGGHLALMTAIGDQSKFTKDSVFGENYGYKALGCVGMSALTVCYEVDGKLLTAVTHLPQLFGGDGNGAAAHEASPLDLISKDMCPILLSTGTDDPAVFPENTYLFRDKAKDVGADVTVIISENAGHSYEPMNGATSVSVSFTELQNKVAEFILELIK